MAKTSARKKQTTGRNTNSIQEREESRRFELSLRALGYEFAFRETKVADRKTAAKLVRSVVRLARNGAALYTVEQSFQHLVEYVAKHI